MATIGKIRERSGWVIAFIGIAMFGFIATDLLSNRLFRSNGPQGIGRVYGDFITPDEYENRLKRELFFKQQQLGPNETISAADETSVNEQVWGSMIMDKIMDKEYAELGIDVTGEEIKELSWGRNTHYVADQYWYQGGRVSKATLSNAFAHMEQNEQLQMAWSRYEELLTNIRLNEKYTALVKNGIFTTDLEAREDFVSKNKIASFQYVPLFANTVQDATVKVSDADLRDYYKKNLEDFKRDESRTFEYVFFDISATAADTLATREWVKEKGDALLKTKADSTFMVSDGKYAYSKNYYLRGELDKELKSKGIEIPEGFEDRIFAADSNTLVGPEPVNGKYVIAKVKSKKKDTLYAYRASHILLTWKGATQTDSDEVKRKAEEILAEVKKPGADFAAIATEKSQDPGSGSKGGDLGWFKKGVMVEPFFNAVKKTPSGGITMVKSQFGWHIIKVTRTPDNTAVQVAVLEKDVKAQGETVNKIYAQAANFSSQATDAASFDAMVKKLGINKRVAENIKPDAQNIAGIESARELIRWAYAADTKIGTVSEPKKLGDKYVIAKLTKSFEQGYAPFEDIKDPIKALVIKEKKKEMLRDKLKAAMDKNKGNLDAVAKEVGSSVNNADNINFANPFVPNIANEPALVGYIFGLQPGKIGGPVVGDLAVFAVKVTTVSGGTPAPGQKFDTEKASLQSQIQNTSQNESIEALRKAADIKDFRYMYGH